MIIMDTSGVEVSELFERIRQGVSGVEFAHSTG